MYHDPYECDRVMREGDSLQRDELSQLIFEKGRQSISLDDFSEQAIAEYLRQKGWICFKKRFN